MAAPSDEARLARLEETLFFQERLIAELNESLTLQQAEIFRLDRELRNAQEHIRELRLLVNPDGLVMSEVPPHYL